MAPSQANSKPLVVACRCRDCGRHLGRFAIQDAAYAALALHDSIRAAIIDGNLQRVLRRGRDYPTGVGLYYDEWPSISDDKPRRPIRRAMATVAHTADAILGVIDDDEWHRYLVKVCKCGSRGLHEERRRVEKVDFELGREHGRDVIYL